MQDAQVTCSTWMDSKAVTIMATNADPTKPCTVQRRQRTGTRTRVPCPECVPLYNQYMRGVDRGDQLRNYYSCRTKGYKFYMYIFWFYFDVAITNSLALYKVAHPASKDGWSMKSFRLSLADSLIGEYNSRKISKVPNSKSPRRLELNHFPMKCPKSDESKCSKRGPCHLCKVNKKRSDTLWQCLDCKIWLCHTGDVDTDCFYKWHLQ